MSHDAQKDVINQPQSTDRTYRIFSSSSFFSHPIFFFSVHCFALLLDTASWFFHLMGVGSVRLFFGLLRHGEMLQGCASLLYLPESSNSHLY